MLNHPRLTYVHRANVKVEFIRVFNRLIALMSINAKVAAISARDETTPLLAASSESPLVQANEESLIEHPSNAPPDDDTPLPWNQLLLLCFARLLEPVAFFSIFPFINQMIKDTGSLDERDVGFYSGLIESLFSLTQMMLMIQWGKASDRFGRKPVLVIALIGMSVSVSLFGFATQIWQMILFRCLAGVFAGTIVTVRAMISEISTPKTQARAFSFFAVCTKLHFEDASTNAT
jgi:hypothetical protein